MRSADFFDVSTHPTLSFKARAITPRSDEELTIAGDLAKPGAAAELAGFRPSLSARIQQWPWPELDECGQPDDGQPVLHLRSKGETSAIIRDLKASVDLKETPIIEWRWKVITLPTGGNACQQSTDDEAAQVYVAWLRSPEAVRSRIIGYVWDSTAPAGTICKSQKTSTVTYIVLRSGADALGKWITERRNVVEDFRKIYGEAPDNPTALSLGIDSDDTRSSAESFIGPTVFTRP